MSATSTRRSGKWPDRTGLSVATRVGCRCDLLERHHLNKLGIRQITRHTRFRYMVRFTSRVKETKLRLNARKGILDASTCTTV
jgi:hypothetical protein